LRVVYAWLEVACLGFKVLCFELVYAYLVRGLGLIFFVIVDVLLGIGLKFEGLELGVLVMGIVLFDFDYLG